jgi:hypothetical protein
MERACQGLILRFKIDGRETESKNSVTLQKENLSVQGLFQNKLGAV